MMLTRYGFSRMAGKMVRKIWIGFALFSFIVALLMSQGCALKSRDNISSLDIELNKVISKRNFTGDPRIGKELADINDPLFNHYRLFERNFTS